MHFELFIKFATAIYILSEAFKNIATGIRILRQL